MDEALLVYTTWPDAETAAAAGRAAIEARLAACANILGPLTSIYRWNGAIESAAEVAMTLKTTAAASEALRALIVERHPYELPCVVALPIAAAGSHPAFVSWIAAECRP